MGKAGTGLTALVHEGVHVSEPLRARGLRPLSPGERDAAELLLVEFREAARVPRDVDDDLLPLEGGEEIRDDPDLPPGGVWVAQLLGEREGLRRRALFATRTERARGELLLARRLENRALGAGPLRALGGDDD
jgi:hypothetical protein